jgi:hypothetical protein
MENMYFQRVWTLCISRKSIYGYERHPENYRIWISRTVQKCIDLKSMVHRWVYGTEREKWHKDIMFVVIFAMQKLVGTACCLSFLTFFHGSLVFLVNWRGRRIWDKRKQNLTTVDNSGARNLIFIAAVEQLLFTSSHRNKEAAGCYRFFGILKI